MRVPVVRVILLAGMVLLAGGCTASPLLGALLGPTATPLPSPTPTATRVLPTAVPSFTPQPTPRPTFTPVPRVSLAAVGDVMLARTVGDRLVDTGVGLPFGGVINEIAGADIAVANLECVIASGGVPANKAYLFRAPPEAAASVALAGFDVVGVANNHTLDYGYDALTETFDLLAAFGVQTVGAGDDLDAAHQPVVVERNGLRVAFLAYVDVPVESGGFDTRTWAATESTPGVAWADPAQMAVDIALARAAADVVVVLLQSGYEGRSQPGDLQRSLSRTAIDAGADLLLGAHPHMLQPIERYNGGLIVYSLGNFVFDGFAGDANDSVIFTAELTADGVVDYALVPVVIRDGLPVLAEGDDAERVLARMLETGE